MYISETLSLLHGNYDSLFIVHALKVIKVRQMLPQKAKKWGAIRGKT